MKDPRTIKLVAYLAGVVIIAVLLARLPLSRILPSPGGIGELVSGLGASPGEAPPGTLAPSRPPAKPTATPDNRTALAMKEGKVIWWYSFDEKVGQQVLAAFRAKYPQISISEHLGLPASQLYPRLLAGVRDGAVAADVVTLTDAEMAQDLQRRGYWAEYRSAQAAGIPDALQSQPLGSWAVTEIEPVGVVWNSRMFDPTTPITGYWDLAQPALKGRFGIAEAAGESQLASWYGLQTALGPAYWEQVGKNRPKLYGSPQSLMNDIAAGQVAAGINVPFSVARQHLQPNGQVRLLLPPEGVPARFGASGLPAAAPRPNAGRLFLDFLLSAEGQRLLATNLRGTYPSRNDGVSPAGLPAMTGLNLIRPSSWEDYAKAGVDFPARWERTVSRWK